MESDIRQRTARWFEEAWNQRNDELLQEMIAPDARIHGLAEDGRTLRGPREFSQFRSGMLSAVPDQHIQIDEILADGDKSAIRFTFRGTHTGDGIGIAPTGRAFISTAIVILQWREGQIIECWNEFDAAGMIRQLTSPDMSTCRVPSEVQIAVAALTTVAPPPAFA